MLNYTPNWSRTSTANGYTIVFCPDHPRAWANGYVYAHRVVLEQKLNRLLGADELPHHRDEDKTNNQPDNLVLLTRAQHTRLHKFQGRDVTELKCNGCGNTFIRSRRNRPEAKKYKSAYCDRQCFWRSLRSSTMHTD